MSSRRQNQNNTISAYQGGLSPKVQNQYQQQYLPNQTLSSENHPQQQHQQQYQQLLVPGSQTHQTSQAAVFSSSGMFPPIENLQQFRQQLMMSLAKFSDTQTCKQASDEMRELMTEHITNTDRMNAFLLMLQEHNEHMRPNHRKELIRLYGAAAEIFEEALLPFMPKILAYLQRKLKENDSLLHGVISESIGALVHQVLKKTESLDELIEQFNPILKLLFNNLQTPNRQLQIGSAISLTRVIQNAPVLVLQTTLPTITQKILEVLAMNTCKCHTQLLESLISLILAVEHDFARYCEQFLPTLLECMTNNDWQVRKMSIDVIYTMAAILREAVAPYKQEILECLSHSRSDKNKPVREATLEAIQAIKDIPSGQTPEPYNQQQQKQEQTGVQTQQKSQQQSFKRPPSSKPQTDSNRSMRQQQQYAAPRELSLQVSMDSLAQNSKHSNNNTNNNVSTTSLPRQQHQQRNADSQRTNNQRDNNLPLSKTYNHNSSRSQTRTVGGNGGGAGTGTNRSRQNINNDGDASKSDFDNGSSTQNLKKTLTSATQKKIARQSEANLPTTSSRIMAQPKESIFKGPRNAGFFSKPQVDGDIEILEGQKPQQIQDEESDYSHSQEHYQEHNDDMSIKIYEGKKLLPYQDDQRLEQHYNNSSIKKNNQNMPQHSPFQQQQQHQHNMMQNSSHKKISPVKKSFLESNDLLSDRKQQQVIDDGYSPSPTSQQIDRSYLSSSQQQNNNNQMKYQQPKQAAWQNKQQQQSPLQVSQTNHQLQQALLLSGNKSGIVQPNQYNSQNDFLSFNHPTTQQQQIPNYLLMSQPSTQLRQPNFDQSQLASNQLQYYLDQQQQQQQHPQPMIAIQQPIPQPIIQSNDQQIQFLIQELQKMHQNQTIMMERMTDYQNQQKNEVFSLQARIAKLEYIINIQNQQNQLLKQSVLSTNSPQPQNMLGYQLLQQNAQTQAVSNPNLSQSFTLSQDNTQNFPNPQLQQQQHQEVNNRPKWGQQQQKPVNNTTSINKNTLWQQIQDHLQNQQLNDAYQVLLKTDIDTLQNISQDDRDLLLIKLIGKTGVCLDKLDNLTIDSLLNRIISILSQREFIDVLLPWLSQITNYYSTPSTTTIKGNIDSNKNNNNNKMDLNTTSNLIECLLLLLSDTSESGGSLNDQQRNEIEQIYLSMNKQMKNNSSSQKAL